MAISLRRPKRLVSGLPADLPDAARQYLEAFPPGRIVGFPLAPLDRTGVPVWYVSLFLDDEGFSGSVPSGIGYGATDNEAIIGAVAEIAENLFPTLALFDRQRVQGTYDDLARERGRDGVADPLTLCLPAGSPVGRGTPLEWTPAVRARTGEEVLVPLDIAAVDLFELPPGYEPFTTLITNGLGAGPDIPFALGHGLLELLQRDGNGLVFRALDQGVVLNLLAVEDAGVKAMLDRLADLGVEALPKYATDEFGLANLYVVGFDLEGFAPPAPIALSACGEACDPDRNRAVRKALLEFQAARVRKSFSHGPLEDAARVTPPGYVEDFLRRAMPSLDKEEGRALRAMMDWAMLSPDELKPLLAGTVFSARSTKSFAELPTVAAPDAHGRGRIARERLDAGGFDILYVDCSLPGRDVGVVKAIVPGLEVETMSYHRIGERNARKLLERDHPLIRFGEETGTLRPVRLTPEALDRFGGRRPLLDTALVDSIVGPLYPLYREPEAHHAAFRLQERERA